MARLVKNAWKCETVTQDAQGRKVGCHLGTEEEFRTPEGPVCPKCGSEDVFPYRLFRCKKCGKVQDQDAWWPEFPLDENPLEEGVEAEPCEECDELEGTPADLEEVPVELPD